jgi:hypothetical protein
MKTRLVAWLAIVLSALLASQPIFAHHSMSIYDMSRTGWYKDALKPQDEITITGNPTKDGSKSIRLEKVLFPNGSTLIGRSR